MYLYLQVENQSSGVPSNRYHCRGEVASEAEAQSFTAKMAERGLQVFVSPAFLGDALIKDPQGSFKAASARAGGPGRPAQASFAPGAGVGT